VVVVPPSVVANWERELLKWGHFSVKVIDAKAMASAEQAVKDAHKGKVEVLLLSQSMVGPFVANCLNNNSQPLLQQPHSPPLEEDDDDGEHDDDEHSDNGDGGGGCGGGYPGGCAGGAWVTQETQRRKRKPYSPPSQSPRNPRFGVLVVDECHKCQNPDSNVHQALKKLVKVSDCRVGLTGTPMSNSYKELFNQLNLLSPGCLGEWKQVRKGWWWL
jgi:SNF2 family DNA or RNA helicase